MHRLKELLRQLVSFSKTESTGSIVLIALIVFCLAVPKLYRSYFGAEYESFSEDRKLLDSLMTLLTIEEPIDEVTEFQVIPFDPNNSTEEELKSLGIPAFLSQRIVNYRESGGKFIVKSDLVKIYDFPDSLFKDLEEYILLPDEIVEDNSPRESSLPSIKRNTQAQVVNQQNRYNTPPLLIDINEADTSKFKKLYGIGSGYAKRLVSFREALGGFHSVEQVQDLYGMTDSLYLQIKSFLHVTDTVTLQTLSINVATFQQLNSHPYIGYEQTKEILSAKSKYGKFKRAEDLSRLTLMDTAHIARLLPYIQF